MTAEARRDPGVSPARGRVNGLPTLLEFEQHSSLPHAGGLTVQAQDQRALLGASPARGRVHASTRHVNAIS